MIDSDPHRFENLANAVAAIDLDGQLAFAPPSRTAVESGLRPALRVEVLEPHALWDARDGLNAAVERAAPRLVAAAAPAVADAVAQQVSARVES
ncbi:MAG: SPOR domain-containing protein, partial [Brevundimonas sp.]|nr:SPOR domain-containing protein [Brevundimonas sp.]